VSPALQSPLGLGSPAVVPLKGDRAFVTARGGDGSIVYKEQQTDGTWPAYWSTIAGEAAAGATRRRSSARPAGRIKVAIRGTDSLIYVAQETAPGSGQFGGWVQVSDPAGEPG
jgi:hypothetical protein